jgi:sarcosine oxidase gamma subunit
MAPFMVSILAISVSDKIEQYGAYAGFASVLGLAVLSLLYFAQAREVKRLREWAGRSPERAADLQDRVQADAQRRAAAVPQAPQARHLPGHPATGPQQPATAAGQAGQGAAVAAPAAAAAATAAGAATKAPAAPGAPGTPPAPGGQPTTVQPAATAAGNGTPPGPVARPGQPLRVSGAQTPPPSTARAASAAADDDDGPRRPLAAILAGVATIAVVVVLLVVFVFNGGKDDNGTPAPNTIGAATPTTTTGAASKAPASTTTLKPGAYTVAVLNGTTTPGLARGVANRLQGAKFKTGTVTNAADQSHSATLVQYAPAHKGEALAVAKAIDVKSDAIQPLDQGARSLAGTDALVVVTVGQDQNQSPQQTP